jgi:hypothetical protein
MFRTKKPLKTNRRNREEEVKSLESSIEISPSPSSREEDLFLSNKGLGLLKALSPPTLERDLSVESPHGRSFTKSPRECRLENDQLRETLYKLGNSLYYLASIIPNEDTWTCHFVDTPPHKNNITKAKDNIISIFATLNSITEQFILLPFGDKPMECGFSRQVEFTLTCDLGRTTVDAYHICERGVHKLIFPEEVTIAGREHNLRNILPVNLEH